jgi:hypothetical protein
MFSCIGILWNLVSEEAKRLELPVRKSLSAVFLTLAYLVGTTPVLACSVCFGDPNSDMAKGVTAGITVLLGVIVTVLLSIVGVMLFWMRRARRFHQAGAAGRLQGSV